jgi:hypothetical protein
MHNERECLYGLRPGSSPLTEIFLPSGARFHIDWHVGAIILEKRAISIILVTLLITGFNINNFYILPAEYICVFYKKIIVSSYNFNWLIFITEIICVFWAVRTESLYTIQFNSTLKVQAIRFSETLVTKDISARRHISQRENLLKYVYCRKMYFLCILLRGI